MSVCMMMKSSMPIRPAMSVSARAASGTKKETQRSASIATAISKERSSPSFASRFSIVSIQWMVFASSRKKFIATRRRNAAPKASIAYRAL